MKGSYVLFFAKPQKKIRPVYFSSNTKNFSLGDDIFLSSPREYLILGIAFFVKSPYICILLFARSPLAPFISILAHSHHLPKEKQAYDSKVSTYRFIGMLKLYSCSSI
jgi:hypothetical protein